jgi:GNAT superfamily N-acetyltransferase
MTIRELRADDLRAFLYSKAYNQSPVLPISRHRALSHLANPRLQPEDVILILAYDEEEELIGYLGVLPDEVYLNHTQNRGGWLSCMWVNPKARGQGIGGKLVGTALKSWGNRILVTEFTPAAKRLYDRTEAFVDLHQPIGLRCFLRFNSHEVLPRKKPLFRKLRGLLRLSDRSLNLVQDLRLKFWNPAPQLRWEYLSEVDAQLEGFFRSRQEGQIFRRGAAELNWMMQFPWVRSGADQDDYSSRYHFSAIDKRFDFLLLKLYRTNGELAGFLMLSVRNQHLKVPYCYVEDELLPEVAKLIFLHLKKMRLDQLSVFHPPLVQAIQDLSAPFIHKRPLRRHYIIAKALAEPLAAHGPVVIQDGDADCAFT